MCSIQLRQLTKEDIPACRALWQARFGDSDAFCDWYFSERFCPTLSIGLFSDGQLCSMAHGRTLQVRFANTDHFPVLMIGGVSTATDCEGRGLMKQVLQRMEQLAKENDIDLLILATETPAIYKSSGFTVCATALYAEATGTNESPLNHDIRTYDVKALLDCCRAGGASMQFFPARTLASMQDRIQELCCEGGGLLTIPSANGGIEGYAFCDPVGKRADEVLARSEDGYWALLSMLPKGTVAMLPPDLPFDGKRGSGAQLMCKPLTEETAFIQNESSDTAAFCPETY